MSGITDILTWLRNYTGRNPGVQAGRLPDASPWLSATGEFINSFRPGFGTTPVAPEAQSRIIDDLNVKFDSGVPFGPGEPRDLNLQGGFFERGDIHREVDDMRFGHGGAPGPLSSVWEEITANAARRLFTPEGVPDVSFGAGRDLPWQPFDTMEAVSTDHFGLEGVPAFMTEMGLNVLDPSVSDVGSAARAIGGGVGALAALFPSGGFIKRLPAAQSARWSVPYRLASKARDADSSRAVQDAFESVQDSIPGARVFDDGDALRIRSAPDRPEIEVYRKLGDYPEVEIYVNYDAGRSAAELRAEDMDDLLALVDVLDAAGAEIVMPIDHVPYGLARGMGFVEDPVRGLLIREPIGEVAEEVWYSEMFHRLGGHDPQGELFQRAGFTPGDIKDELSAVIARSERLNPIDREAYWSALEMVDFDDPNSVNQFVNLMTEEGLIDLLPGEDFTSLRRPPAPRPPSSSPGAVPVGGGGFDLPDKEQERLQNLAAKMRKAHEDAIRRGSPWTTNEWKNFFEIEGVRMPTGDPDNPFRSLTTDEVRSMRALMEDPSSMPIGMSDDQFRQILSSEFGRPVGAGEMGSLDSQLSDLGEAVSRSEHALNQIVDLEIASGHSMPITYARQRLRSLFGAEEAGESNVLIDWAINANRTAQRYADYDVRGVLERGVDGLRAVSSRPTVGGTRLQPHQLLELTRTIGGGHTGNPKNLFEVVTELQRLYPDVPLEELQHIAEMALL